MLSLTLAVCKLAACNPIATQTLPSFSSVTAIAPTEIPLTVTPTMTPLPAALPIPRIQFLPRDVNWQTTGNLEPNSALRFVLAAQKIKLLTVELTVTPDLDAGLPAIIKICGADNQILTSNPTMIWKGVLTVSDVV